MGTPEVLQATAVVSLLATEEQHPSSLDILLIDGG
jgi:hypothetical protein